MVARKNEENKEEIRRKRDKGKRERERERLEATINLVSALTTTIKLYLHSLTIVSLF